MILFLTYHKVLPAHGNTPKEFYTVTTDQFERHLTLLQDHGMRPLALESLLAGSPPAGPRYLISFDDGTRDHVEQVLPILQRRTCRALFFVPTAKLNRPGQLTDGQVRELAAAGQIIGSHSHEHRRLDRLRDEDIRAQLDLSLRIVADLVGAKPICFAPPGGYMNQRVETVALESGLRVIRTMRWGYNQRLDLTRLETVSPNRFTTEAGFRRFLGCRGRRSAYFAKEFSKRILPERSYHWLRDCVSSYQWGSSL